ncbi:5'-adenylylsulfate reductase-like 4 [Sarracenia purpurea var. burkii]
MAGRAWEAGLVLLVVVFGRLTRAEHARVPSSNVCPAKSVMDTVLGFQDLSCPITGDESVPSIHAVGVTEGDEVSLQRALSLVHKNSNDYVALLFYASWCPFSGTFRPTLSILSSLYPSIPHFAIEVSVIRPSILSKYGVHGFPTLFLVNSTMRMHYHGSRTLGSLVAFYNDVTGLKTAPLDGTYLERLGRTLVNEENNNNEQEENCPFSWARSPENLLQQETYLALATAFVLLRLLYFVFPTLFTVAQLAWKNYILNVRFRSFLEYPLAYMNRAILLLNSLKEPGKRSNLQEGAMNAKAWASKSLVSVSFGDASTSRVMPGS